MIMTNRYASRIKAIAVVAALCGIGCLVYFLGIKPELDYNASEIAETVLYPKIYDLTEGQEQTGNGFHIETENYYYFYVDGDAGRKQEKLEQESCFIRVGDYQGEVVTGKKAGDERPYYAIEIPESWEASL